MIEYCSDGSEIVYLECLPAVGRADLSRARHGDLSARYGGRDPYSRLLPGEAREHSSTALPSAGVLLLLDY